MGQKKLDIQDTRSVQGMAAMGGGIASTGGTCGVIIGAAFCVGMLYGKENPEEGENPDLWRTSRSFYKRFLQEVTSGRVHCSEITGVDWSDKDQIKAFLKGEGRVRCAGYTGQGARILGEVLQRYNAE